MFHTHLLLETQWFYFYKENDIPLFDFHLLSKIECLKSLSLSLSVQGYRLEGSNIGNDGEEVCPSITTFSDLLEAEK